MELLLDFVIVGISMGIVYGLVALGISLIFSGLDIVHFAHGEVELREYKPKCRDNEAGYCRWGDSCRY